MAPKKKVLKAEAASELQDQDQDQEADSCNEKLIIRTAEAMAVVTGHPMFADIVQALPLGVGEGESGCQAPFETTTFFNTLKARGTYTCGGNMFWTKWGFTATPGIPIRESSIDHLMEHYFAKPCAMQHSIVVTIRDPSANPLDHRGALHAISPEEMRCAMLFAIARDVGRNAPEEDLKEWRCHALSVSMQFFHHATHEEMYFAACQLRENLAVDHEWMSRTALQRIYEIARFRDSQIRLYGPSAGTASAVCKAYEHVKVASNQIAYTLGAVDAAITVMNRMLKIPQVQARLLAADAWPRGKNPFDSVHKLEILMRKGKDQSGIIWLVDSIWQVVTCRDKAPDSEDFTQTGLRGKAASGNRGYVDVLMFKRESIQYLLGSLPKELGLDTDWCTSVARPKMETVAAHLEACKDPTWRAGINKPTLAYTSFVEEYLFGTTYDACIKALVKSSKQPSGIALQPGITEQLAEIRNEMSLLLDNNKTETQDSDKAMDATDDQQELQDHVQVTIRTKDPKNNVQVDTSGLGDEFREKIQHCRELIKQRVDASVALVSKSSADTADLGAALGATAAGRYTGPRNVAVIYDSKLHGEAQHKPSIRLPPVQIEDVKRCLEAARGRARDVTDLNHIPPTDLYFLLDGGRDVQGSLTMFFKGKETSTKQLHIVYEATSTLKRYERVRGCAVHSALETVKVVAAKFPASLNVPRPRKYYKGTTALNVLYDVPVPS